MTRKDYIAIAAAFADNRPANDAALARYQWNIDVRALTRVLANDNPRFDRVKFMQACGMEVE